jgi:Protein of unknown function (DUF2809)
MLPSRRAIRLSALVVAAFALAVALAIRATRTGAVVQVSGTALYASMVYAAVVFLWPRVAAVPAGAIAIGFCWAMELFQLTGVPAALSAHSLLARLVLGVQFDPLDLAWYPAGVVPLVALELLFRVRTGVRTGVRAGFRAGAGPGRRGRRG